jgi:hypothetical protein
MFEMKNENDDTARKHKNEEFFKKLDKDRNDKKCEYAVLVSMLEMDNELYNGGIVDVSHIFPKMYVIRPQFFIPLITLLRNMAQRNDALRAELKRARQESIDITNFETELDKFKVGFARNTEQASRKFADAIEQIDRAIANLEKVKESFRITEKHLNAANNKSEALTIKRLTRDAPMLRERFAELAEERYRQSLTAGRYEDYRLISKLLNESRADCERERALDHDLSDRLALLFTECGLSDVVVKVIGERRRHLIAAGEDPDGSLITSPELHAGIEKLLDAKLGEAEYFRRGTTALIEVEAARRLSAESAVATIQGSSGEVSGDVSCAFTSKDGYFYSLLSDGMGSGELARETADFVTKFLSYLLRTGGFRDTALCLLNNIVRRRGEECSATIDLFELDLIRGDALFIKSGAAPSYVKRGSSIFRIRSETAPIGLMNQVDAERMRAEVREGDYVIMLSDGVSSTPEDAPWLLELLTEPPRRSLKEYAELILSEAVKNSNSGDDMTVLVTKISADSDRRA